MKEKWNLGLPESTFEEVIEISEILGRSYADNTTTFRDTKGRMHIGPGYNYSPGKKIALRVVCGAHENNYNSDGDCCCE